MRRELPSNRRGGQPRPWTPAQLGSKGLYWSGRTLASVASATNGTGPLTGADDTSLAAYLADLSASAKPLVQATSGARPVVRASALGRGIAVHGDGASKYLEAASTTAGVRHCWIAFTPRGDNVARSAGDEPANFANQWQAYVAGDAVSNPSSAIVVGEQYSNNLLVSGTLTADYYRSGVLTSPAAVLRQRRRVVAHVHRTASAMDTGRVRALVYPGNILWAQGCIHEIVLADNTLTAGEIAQLDAYFAWHDAAPVVACSVDSLTACLNLAQDQAWPHLLWRSRWGGCVSGPNFGVPDQTVTDAITGDPAKLAAVKGTGKNILVLLGGANDILDGASAATVWTRLQAYVTAATAAGWQVVICSVPQATAVSGGYTAGQLTVIGDLRTLIAAGWAAAGCSAYVDLYALTLTRQADGIHFTSADAALVADAVGAVVDTLL